MMRNQALKVQHGILFQRRELSIVLDTRSAEQRMRWHPEPIA
jgi:hypothetical protein